MITSSLKFTKAHLIWIENANTFLKVLRAKTSLGVENVCIVSWLCFCRLVVICYVWCEFASMCCHILYLVKLIHVSPVLVSNVRSKPTAACAEVYMYTMSCQN